MGEKDTVGRTPNDEVSVGKIAEEGDDFNKKGISVEEVSYPNFVQEPLLLTCRLWLITSKTFNTHRR